MNNKRTVPAIADRTGVSSPVNIGIAPGKEEKLYAAKRKLKKGETGMDNPQPDAEIVVSEMPMGPGEVANFAIHLQGSPALKKIAKALMENPVKDKYIPSARIHGGNILVDTEEEASKVVEGIRADLWKSGIKDQEVLGRVLYSSSDQDLATAKIYADKDMSPMVKFIRPEDRQGRAMAEAIMARKGTPAAKKLERVSSNPTPLSDIEEESLASAWNNELDKRAKTIASALQSGDAKAINEAKQEAMELDWPEEMRDDVREMLGWKRSDVKDLIQRLTQDEY